MLEKIKQKYRESRLEIYKCLIKKIPAPKGAPLCETSLFSGLEKFLEKNDALDLYEDLCAYAHEVFEEKSFSTSQRGLNLLNYVYFKYFKSRFRSITVNDKELIANSLFIRSLIEFLESNNRVFVDFDALKEFLEMADFSLKEKADIVVSIALKNSDVISSGKYRVPCDKEALRRSEIKKTYKYMIDYILDYNAIDSESILLKMSAKDAIEEFVSMYPLDIKDIQTNCDNVTNFIRGNSSSEDELSASLTALGFEDLCGILIGKRKKEESKELMRARREEAATLKKVVSSTKKTKTLSGKEVNRILIEIRKVYDFDTDKCLTTLSMDKIIEYTSKLMMINADKKTIEKFLFSFEKRLRQDPINGYRQLLGKMHYLIKDEPALSYLREVESTIDGLIYEVDLKRGLEKVNECVKMINSIIDQDFTYEYERARALLEGEEVGKGPKSL